ncbi:cupin domain-containing protein [Terriglobus aquaticus]|uniref:Cupin domain-containing protein n=1 Tax=Terriglobus aquaticus TaxID=940139 RepID=A0ABW9KQQ5_9BACT|nr:cupin domain-containing protein [Terriglobus aquaticus]
MRLRIVLPALTGCLLVCGATAYGQQSQGLVSCKPASQKTGDVGCWILTNFPVGTPAGPVYWTLDTFPSRDIAEQARGPQSVVLESLGKVWLSTVGDRPKEVPGGTRVTVVGPLTVRPGVSYAAQVMEATLQPGMVSKTHLHSGVEAFYTESGASCLETPAGKQIGKKGSDIVVPEGVPMELTAVGPDTRRGLILILHDASKPPTTLVDDWKSKHLCAAEK